jgi:hypothetical protein
MGRDAKVGTRKQAAKMQVDAVLLLYNFQDNTTFDAGAYIIGKDDAALKKLSDNAHALEGKRC